MNNFYSSHFKNAIWLTAICVATVTALSDVNTDCIARNNGTLSNQFLLGTWHLIYEFLPVRFSIYFSCVCAGLTFTRSTEEELRGYRKKYSSIDLPHTIGDDTIVANPVFEKALILGGAEAKTYILDPDSVVKGYEIHVFKLINDKYLLHWKCDSRGQLQWLYTRDLKAPEEEIQQIITDASEITYKKNGIRYCNRTCDGVSMLI